ncbi:MAG: NifB/NifX family molybdenum-iron cluster-binding protein [Actinomycetaceae bacterium]|nr:NifB/NifX family molybdenum-iron cluster-binding protein [Actinomycetaceae bacterium]
MYIALPVTDHGDIDSRWGRAHFLAIAETDADTDKLVGWEVTAVRWDELHDSGEPGTHHGRIIKFLKENAVDIVVCHHMGPGIAHSIDKMGIMIVKDAAGDARTLVNTYGKALRDAYGDFQKARSARA